MSIPIQAAQQVGPGSAIERAYAQSGLGQGGLGQTDGLGQGSFKDTLSRALGETQALQDQSSDAVQAFLRGEPVELHDVMAAVEEAGIALEMLIAVRDRMVEAYRTVVNMQT
ncbi:MAG: flagellar hook-basal body complex protein FliE [Longimicrobiales bacterium]